MVRPKFPDETILSNARVTLANARKHVAALAGYGVTEEMLDGFDSRIQTVAGLPTDAVHRLSLKALTGDKNAAIEDCYDWGQGQHTRLKFVFGKQSPQADSFPSKAFHAARNSETRMAAVMEVLITLGEQHKDALATAGQTPEVLAKGRELLEKLRSADDKQELKKTEKISGNRKRYQELEQLYETTNRVNEIGRLVFKNDPEKRALFKSRWPR